MSALPQKVDLLKWVESQRQLDSVSKYILEKLARFADAEGCAWSKIDTLAEAVNASVRTVQMRLRALESDGIIEPTGRTHRLKNSTRSVPIYQLAPRVEGFGLTESMGAEPAPIDGVWVQNSAAMGAAVCTRIDPIGTEGESIDSPVRERARERAAFKALEEAYPREGLRTTDREAAWIALCALAADGAPVEAFADCAARMGADPSTKKRDFGPPSMQAWLTRGQWRGWMLAPDAPAAAEAPAEGEPAPGGIPADLAADLGADFCAAWAPGALWRAADKVIITRLGVQADQFNRERRAVLKAHGVRVMDRREAFANFGENV